MLRYDYEEYEEVDSEDADDEHNVYPQAIPDYMTKRGTTGVFDIEDLRKLLEDERALDVICIPVPPQCRYCDYLVILTGKSYRHLRAMAEKIKKLFKTKRSSHDPESVNIEGNIVVHLFLEETRKKYNLEELWTVGPELDSHCIQERAELEGIRNKLGVGRATVIANGHKISPSDFSFDEELERIKKLRLAEKLEGEKEKC
ncbi:hypothetical protein HELRODRAFT_171028 [Helobdella robusta]|uniref:Uncharacterized protein n=1 Tax=Helobdella robusta TaxID=6412 RepID=T1F3Q4_HELRO|nr:hypothetical protein HELRODRAFT_171028 [Helobdella robusta]ESO06993.1 hypothetical protein HELRODRAFT_171028 [Helobdella robusta]